MELKELALRIRRGDREALKALISEYGVGVYQKAYQKTQDKVLAREATRQTFAQLVTALQEQTDMDGWELWLNALAKRNIETYTNIGSDMAFLENQLDRELFSSGEQATHAVRQSANQFALQQQQEAQQAQARLQQQQYEAQQAQLLAKQQYEAQQAQLLAKQQYEAQQAQLLAKQQYEAQQAQLRMQQQQQYEAQQAQLQQQQYEAQQAKLRLQQYEAQLAAQQPAPEPVAQQPAEAPPQMQLNGLVEAAPALPEETVTRPAKKRKKRGNRGPGSAWPVIVLLTLLCLLLVWLVLGVVMSFGWLPKTDIGYEWFNEHILDLF